MQALLLKAEQELEKLKSTQSGIKELIEQLERNIPSSPETLTKEQEALCLFAEKYHRQLRGELRGERIYQELFYRLLNQKISNRKARFLIRSQYFKVSHLVRKIDCRDFEQIVESLQNSLQQNNLLDSLLNKSNILQKITLTKSVLSQTDFYNNCPLEYSKNTRTVAEINFKDLNNTLQEMDTNLELKRIKRKKNKPKREKQDAEQPQIEEAEQESGSLKEYQSRNKNVTQTYSKGAPHLYYQALEQQKSKKKEVQQRQVEENLHLKQSTSLDQILEENSGQEITSKKQRAGNKKQKSQN